MDERKEKLEEVLKLKKEGLPLKVILKQINWKKSSFDTAVYTLSKQRIINRDDFRFRTAPSKKTKMKILGNGMKPTRVIRKYQRVNPNLITLPIPDKQDSFVTFFMGDSDRILSVIDKMANAGKR